MEPKIGQTLTDKNGNNFTVTAICPYLCQKQREGDKPCVMAGRFHYRHQYDLWCFTSTRNRPSFEFCKSREEKRAEDFDYEQYEKEVEIRRLFEMDKFKREFEIGNTLTDINGKQFTILNVCPYRFEGDTCSAPSPCILSENGFYEDERRVFDPSTAEVIEVKKECSWQKKTNYRSSFNSFDGCAVLWEKRRRERRKREILEKQERKNKAKGGSNGK
jgi:hypothetical protein